jgi:hypothetical protein
MPVFTPELIARHAATVTQPTPDPPDKPSHAGLHAALGVMGGGALADALTTIAALKREGTHEANPIYGKDPSAARILATKAATTIPSALLLDKLGDKHKVAAMLIALGIGGASFGIAAKNAQQGK